MTDKNSTLLQIKESLKPIAESHTPEGSSVESVLDQWTHALATDSDFFCNTQTTTPVDLKTHAIHQLQSIDLPTDKDTLFELVFEHLAIQPSKTPKFKFIDLFAGIGGVRLGFQQNHGTCVFSSEFDKHAQQTYQNNHGEFPFGDITLIPPSHIPDHDVLLGGFPCQAFSIAGYRQGFEDEKGRGNLFFNIHEILKVKRPNAFLLENVKNLQSHDNGKTFNIILDSLEDLGYQVTYRVLNTMHYGNIPQTRERVYIVGFLSKDAFESFEWPCRQPLKTTIKQLLSKNVDESFFYEKYACHQSLKEHMKDPNKVYQWRRHYVRENKSNVCPTLTANMGTGGHNVPLILDHNNRIRKLTPKECSRVQGFPENFKLPKIANSHLYKQFGNSVSVPVIEKIASNIVEAIEF